MHRCLPMTLPGKSWKIRSGNTAPMTSRQPALNIKAHICGRLPNLQVTCRQFDYLTGRYYLPLKWQRRTRGRRKEGWPGGTTCCSGGWSKWRLSVSAGSFQWPVALPPALSPLQPLQGQARPKKRNRKLFFSDILGGQGGLKSDFTAFNRFII